MPTTWPASTNEFDRALRVIPGGVNSPARAFGAVGGQPLVMNAGRGARLTDVDGNDYIDYIGSWGPLILGHRHPAVESAMIAAIQEGWTFGAPTPREAVLAERIIEAMPGVEMVRMTSSGTEASMTAVRLVRGATGRDKIIKFAGCYHGHVDSLLLQAGSSATTLGVPSSPGVPANTVKDTIVVPFNDLDAVAAVFRQWPGQIAGVLLEPVVGNMGLVAPVAGFLDGLRELTRRDGALLVFDEVMTGFRLAFGGAQQRLQITPDLTILGKIVGGGMPVGAVAGPAAVMKHLMPAGKVFQAGTLSGNPVGMAAGIATLEVLQQTNPYPDLERKSARLADGLAAALAKTKTVGHVARVGSMLTLFFHPGPVRNYADATACDTKKYARFFWELIRRGVYFPCSQFEALFLSTAHTDADIDHTITAAEQALADSGGVNHR